MNIEDLKNIHKDQRCFIIGNGPSLNDTDFSLIKDEILFGCNALYKGFDKFGINCQYYGISDMLSMNQYARDVFKLDTTFFMLRDASGQILEEYSKNHALVARVIQIKACSWEMYKNNFFSRDLVKGVCIGRTIVIDICLQAAHYMGFSKVYLIGCDTDYSNGHNFYDRNTSDINLSYVNRTIKSYEVCKRAFEEDGREIINSTVGGKLEVFKRQSLEEVMNE